MNSTTKTERDLQRTKRVTSYNELLEEFGSRDLRSVGNYDVGHLIGKGSFGKVYLASHKLIRNSRVVLKSTSKDDANLPREVHHHRQFLHPHIARLYEVVVTESNVWLVLEYCPGDELFNYLTKHGPMDVAIVQKIFAQLVGAVAYVHGKSCVHRDLKLENILLDKNDNVKLVDFGFTREYEGKASYLQTWCGTVCYSAPEMLKGEKYAGEKVDVWSLGIILYALLCGELPFDEDDDNATKMKIMKEEPNYPEHMPMEAKELIAQLLSKRPLLRPTLSDILNNPWLIEHGPQQQSILKIQRPAPFSTPLEADLLQNMRAVGVNIDRVKDHVISERCDSLAGWWALLLEREERKEERRMRRRRAREAEGRSSRRASRASAMDLAAATISEEPEEKSPASASEHRGRDMQRLNGEVIETTPERPVLPLDRKSTEILSSSDAYPIRETQSTPLSSQVRPTPLNSATRRRSQLGAGVSRNSSTLGGPLQLSGTVPGALSPDTNSKKLKKRYMQPLASIKQWFKGHNPKPEQPPQMPQSILKTRTGDGSYQTRGNSAQSRNRSSTPNPKRLSGVNFAPTDALISSPTTTTATTTTPITRPVRPALSVHTSATSSRRVSSHTPSPVTPSSSFRTTSRSRALSSHSHASHHRSHTPGRNSTSSSISSVRSSSFGHTRGQPSKGSDSSTNSGRNHVSASSYGSPHHLNINMNSAHPYALSRRSPHSSVKVLPGLPGSMGAAQLPSGYRINRAGAPRAVALEANAAFGVVPGPGSPGLKGPVFARRKRSVFKGPMLGPGVGRDGRRKSAGLGDGRSGSAGRLAVTTEEDEEEEDEGDGGMGGGGTGDEVAVLEYDEDVEEVDYFSPVKGPGEVEILFDARTGMKVER